MSVIREFFIMLTSAIGIDGQIRRPGAVVKAAEPLAKDLLRRGKGRPATEQEIAEAGYSVEVDGDDAPAPGGEGSPKPSDGLTVAQLKERLKQMGIDIPSSANRKDELAALLDSAPQ